MPNQEVFFRISLGAVNFSAVFNQIRDGMRYVTGMALTLAYHAL
nr:DUF3218 family protein [Pseudomonas aeruginosa]